MKKISFLIAFITLSLIITSCNQEDTGLDNLVNKSLTFDEFFEKVSSTELEISNENVIYIDYNWDKKNNTVFITKVEEKEPDFFVLENRDISKNKNYTVTCNNGDNSWSKDCGNKWSCGSLVADCLDQGGCATICKKQMVYVPQYRTFYLN